jgi:1,4-dihydroxy-2-naphthoyl-CoA hydrolase
MSADQPPDDPAPAAAVHTDDPGLPPPVVPYEETFAAFLDIDLTFGDDTDGSDTGGPLVTGRIDVGHRHMQPYGIVHGGVYASIAESLASVGTLKFVAADGLVAMGLSNNTSFLRPVSAGTLTAEGEALHRGRTTWLWDVAFRDDSGRLCATSRVTIAVRPAPGAR